MRWGGSGEVRGVGLARWGSSPVPTHDGGGHQCSSVAISMEALLCQLMMGEAINAHQSQSAWKLSCANSASSSLGGRSCWYSPTPRDLGSTRTSSAMGSCECERRPSEVIRGHQRSSGVIRGHEIAHLQPASERSCADRGWVECRVCHLHAMREAISMQSWRQSACNEGGRSPLGRVSGLPPACIEGGNQHAMREAISMQ